MNPEARLPEPQSPVTAPAVAPTYDLSPRFTGTGSEYFGIWIVNLLLIVVTLSLYYPWARVRSLQFFASHTEAAGYPFEFTGLARQMFTGFTIALIVFVLYTVAGEIDPRLGWLAFGSGVLLWPWLMRAALRFRLSKSRWRGLSMRFAGTTREAYRMLTWPMAIVVALVASPWFTGPDVAMAPVEPAGDIAPGPDAVAIGQGLLLLMVVALIPFVHHRISRYQHANFVWGDRSTRFSARLRSFYALHLGAGALVLALILLPLLPLLSTMPVLVEGWHGYIDLPAVLAAATTPEVGPTPASTPDPRRRYLSIALVMLALYLPFAFQLVSAWFSCRSFNLRWSNTTADGVRFEAGLRFWRWFALRIRNLLLTLLTLGLYKPFAQVAVARMKLAALRVTSSVDPSTLLAGAIAASGSAAPDAMADLFDLDIGL